MKGRIGVDLAFYLPAVHNLIPVLYYPCHAITGGPMPVRDSQCQLTGLVVLPGRGYPASGRKTPPPPHPLLATLRDRLRRLMMTSEVCVGDGCFQPGSVRLAASLFYLPFSPC